MEQSWNPLSSRLALEIISITPARNDSIICFFDSTERQRVDIGVYKSWQCHYLYCSKTDLRKLATENKTRTQISVFIFYSHMLHFALNVQVILSGQTQKVWVSTYSNVLYSLFIHTGEHARAFSYNLHPFLIGYLVAVIYIVGTAKSRREEKLSKQRSSMHEFKRMLFQVLTCSLKIPWCSTTWPSISKPDIRDICSMSFITWKI